MNMRTTIDIPEDLFRRAKATAALDGGTLKDLVTEALRMYLDRDSKTHRTGWRSVFGLAASEEDRKEFEKIEARIEEAFEVIDPEDWA